MGAEDGTVWQYDAVTGQQGLLLLRCALPIRDIAVSRDGEWAAVASEYVGRSLENGRTKANAINQ